MLRIIDQISCPLINVAIPPCQDIFNEPKAPACRETKVLRWLELNEEGVRAILVVTSQ
jgi:hypothetical protein